MSEWFHLILTECHNRSDYNLFTNSLLTSLFSLSISFASFFEPRYTLFPIFCPDSWQMQLIYIRKYISIWGEQTRKMPIIPSMVQLSFHSKHRSERARARISMEMEPFERLTKFYVSIFNCGKMFPTQQGVGERTKREPCLARAPSDLLLRERERG